MISINKLKHEFHKNGGVMKTCELNSLGLSSRQIKRLLDDQIISRIKHGYYILSNTTPREEVIISRLFPNAIIYLESALLHYNYTDRIPNAWQIAVKKHSNPNKYDISYLPVKPYYIKEKYLNIGINTVDIDKATVKIYDCEKTICDVLRYENKLENEVFTNAIKRYINDKNKNIRRLMEYAKKLKVTKKVQTYIGVWV
ncbi:MAG: hypothetical protein K9K76_10215 [Halanaerobiales bacterium]|nr:hypothetical protein [Halanaerobiales bacterium]